MTPPERPRARLVDADHPFFARAWVRWAAALAPLAWAALELWWGNPGWAAIFGGLGAWAFWALIVRGPSRPRG